MSHLLLIMNIPWLGLNVAWVGGWVVIHLVGGEAGWWTGTCVFEPDNKWVSKRMISAKTAPIYKT